MASTTTQADGSYSISYKNTPNNVYLAAYAFWQDGAVTHSVRIGTDPWGAPTKTFGVTSSSFVPADQKTLSLTVLENQGGGAFNIVEQLRLGRVLAKSTIGSPPTLWVKWDGWTNQPWLNGSYYDPAEQYIHVNSCFEDRDEYDDSVILHEYAHHVSFSLSQDDNPGGFHMFNSASDPNLAWSEGFATWFGQQVGGSPVYVDVYGTVPYYYDLEVAQLGCTAKAYLSQSQDLCESVVAGVLWDISDSAAEVNDALAMGPEEILDVTGQYLISPQLKDRFEPGVDFVEFLDGWFCRGHQKFADINQIVVLGYKFPYDFAGPCQKTSSPLSLRARVEPAGEELFLVSVELRSAQAAPAVVVRMEAVPGVDILSATPEVPSEMRECMDAGRDSGAVAAAASGRAAGGGGDEKACLVLPVLPGVPTTWTLLVHRTGSVGNEHGIPLHPELRGTSPIAASAILVTARYSPGPGSQWATAAAAFLEPPVFAPPPGRTGRTPDGAPAWLVTVDYDR